MTDVINQVRKVLKQKAVYWGVSRFDDSGRPVYEEPVEIDCRWEDISEQYVDSTGHDHMSNSIVMVDRDVTEQGVLWLGKMEDLESQVNPMENEGAYEIKKKGKLPDRKAKKFFREVFL